jgi:hypothetical protein
MDLTKPYKVKLVSQTNAILLIAAALLFFFAEVLIFYPHGLKNQALSILVPVLHLALVIYLWQKFVTGKTEWAIDKTGVRIKWIKRFPLRNSGDYSFKWDEIESVRRGFYDPRYYTLKIELNSGQTYAFYHGNSIVTDDFKAMLTTLYQTFEQTRNLQPT